MPAKTVWMAAADLVDRIAAFRPDLDRPVTEGTVTLEKVRVISYRHSESQG